jgi:hypothetical protein
MYDDAIAAILQVVAWNRIDPQPACDQALWIRELIADRSADAASRRGGRFARLT